MLFNSYGFLFLFFPLALAGYGICQRIGTTFRGGIYASALRVLYLLGVSFIFYGCFHPEYLPVLLGSMAVNYVLYRQMERSGNSPGPVHKQADRSGRLPDHRTKKAALLAGLAVNLGALIFFKYLGTGNFVPLGVSFYTFTQTAFLIEAYRGNLKQVSALSYGLYVSFFPKMIQGPIAMPGEILPQFQKSWQKADWEQVYRNLYLFVLGLFKKVLIADTLGKAADFGYANPGVLNSGDGLIVMLAYTLQLYFDFSGYCDMAMGIAGMFGTALPLNFHSPYKASNILEFWKRWHMTLTGFFTKYLYIPLGGSRRGKARTYLNCLIVFLISGIWHGAGWQFLVWGLMHGVLDILTRIWMDLKGSRMKTGLAPKAGHGAGVLLTFLYVNVAWIFFRAPSVKEAVGMIKTILRCSFGKINWELAGCFNLDEFWYVIKVLGLDGWPYAHYILMVLILVILLLTVFFGKNAAEYVRTVKPDAVNTAVMAFLFVWSILSFSQVSSFLYVNF